MPFAAFLPLLAGLAICLVPVWLWRRQALTQAQDRLVAPGYTPPQIIRNAAIAASLRLALFAPFFALGARGDFWPVIAAAAGIALAIFLVHRLRQPVLAFLAAALRSGESVTVHALLARLHDGDARVRRLAAWLSLFTLAVIVAAEAFALSGFLGRVLDNDMLARGLTILALVLAVAYAFPGGHPGSLYAEQLQLGLIQLGLYGAAGLLIYLHLSELTPLPPEAAFGLILTAVLSTVMLVRRHARYVDAALIDDSRGARWLSRFEKIFNPAVAAVAVALIVFALMDAYAVGLSEVATAGLAALQPATGLPPIAFAALLLLPLCHPLADVTLWQRLAAAVKNEDSYAGDTSRWLSQLGEALTRYTRETALLWLFFAALGGLAGAAMTLPGDAGALQTFLQTLLSGDNALATALLALLFMTAVLLALGAMSAALSAGVCTLRQDLLPARAPASASLPGRAFFLAIVLMLALADAILPMDFSSSRFLALVFALTAPVLAFVPLLLAPALGWRVSPKAALLILGSGPAIMAAGILGFAAAGNEAWLWAVVPAILASGFLLLAVASGQGRLMR
jgi:hypothetical protein